MAFSTNFISLLFFISLFSSLQIYARESHFFSKAIPLNNNSNAKGALLPSKEASVTGTEHEQKPTFVPETQNSYGLYGRESDQLPPSTTTLNENDALYTADNYGDKGAYEANYNRYFDNRNDMKNAQRTGSGFGSNFNNNNYYFNKDAYEANLKDLGKTRLTETSDNSMSNQNNNRYYDNNNAANKFRMEKQGMSDTRFLEGGRYYYDIDAGKNHPTMYENSREVGTRNWYRKNKGYKYVKNENTHDNNNSMYQNQEGFEEDQDEFQP